MIPAWIEATLFSLIAVTVVDDPAMLRIGDRLGRISTMARECFIASPRFGFIGHRYSPAEACRAQSADSKTLLEELQDRLLAKAGSGNESGLIAASIPGADPLPAGEPTLFPPNRAPEPFAIDKYRVFEDKDDGTIYACDERL